MQSITAVPRSVSFLISRFSSSPSPLAPFFGSWSLPPFWSTLLQPTLARPFRTQFFAIRPNPPGVSITTYRLSGDYKVLRILTAQCTRAHAHTGFVFDIDYTQSRRGADPEPKGAKPIGLAVSGHGGFFPPAKRPCNRHKSGKVAIKSDDNRLRLHFHLLDAVISTEYVRGYGVIPPPAVAALFSGAQILDLRFPPSPCWPRSRAFGRLCFGR